MSYDLLKHMKHVEDKKGRCVCARVCAVHCVLSLLQMCSFSVCHTQGIICTYTVSMHTPWCVCGCVCVQAEAGVFV